MRITKRQLKQLIQQEGYGPDLTGEDTVPDFDTTWTPDQIEVEVQKWAKWLNLNPVTDKNLVDKLRRNLTVVLSRDASGYMGLIINLDQIVWGRYSSAEEVSTAMQKFFMGSLGEELSRRLRGVVLKPPFRVVDYITDKIEQGADDFADKIDQMKGSVRDYIKSDWEGGDPLEEGTNMIITRRQLRQLIEQSIIPDPDTRWSDKDVDEYVQQLEDFFGLNKSTDAKLIHDIRIALKKRLQRDRSGFLGLWDNFEQTVLYPLQSRGLKQVDVIESLPTLVGLEIANKLAKKVRGGVIRTGHKIVKEGTKMRITKRQLNQIIKEELSRVSEGVSARKKQPDAIHNGHTIFVERIHGRKEPAFNIRIQPEAKDLASVIVPEKELSELIADAKAAIDTYTSSGNLPKGWREN